MTTKQREHNERAAVSRNPSKFNPGDEFTVIPSHEHYANCEGRIQYRSPWKSHLEKYFVIIYGSTRVLEMNAASLVKKARGE